MEKINFLKRLTLLFLRDDCNDYDNFILNTFGTVFFANDEKEALSLFNQHHVDILLVEINNNDENKYQFINTINLQRTFMITMILSNNKSIETLNRAIELDIDEFIINPIDKNNFTKRINKLEAKYQLFEEHQNNKENLNLLKQYQDIADSSSIISKTDASGKITYANDNFCKASGYTKDELIGRNHNIIRDPETPPELFKDLWNTIKVQKKQWNGIVKNITKGGKTYYVKTAISPITNENGVVVEYIALRQNISSILSDKKHFLDIIEASDLSILILVQIAEFDLLEKFYNLSTIDQIEKMFGYQILSYLPSEFKFDNVYNLDNGKFALLANFEDFDKTNLNLDNYLKEFVHNVKVSSLEIGGVDYDLNISLSYALGKHMIYEDAKSGLIEAIDKNIIICHSNDFSIRHQEEAKKNLDVIKMVKIALDNFNIVSYFQPIIDNKTKKIDKYESLVRLIDENGKILSPFAFLDISKKGSYYNKITKRVLENSFKMLNRVTTKLSINLSTLDIEKDETRELIFTLLAEYSNDTNRLIFELLEDERVVEFQKVKDFITHVKALGVSIAIDDFGTGYSNFERVLEFQPDIIKIDGSLVKNIINNEFSRNAVETIVAFAKKRNIETIAEYVETEEIFDYLNNLGVDYSQGYYFGKPEELILN